MLVILVLTTEKGLATDSSIFHILTSRMSGHVCYLFSMKSTISLHVAEPYASFPSDVRPPATAQTLSQRGAFPRHTLRAIGLSLTTGKHEWPDVDLLVEDRLPSRVEDSDVGVEIGIPTTLTPARSSCNPGRPPTRATADNVWFLRHHRGTGDATDRSLGCRCEDAGAPSGDLRLIPRTFCRLSWPRERSLDATIARILELGLLLSCCGLRHPAAEHGR
ncbi:hypothetical protein EDB83DRAFT_205676 [Lactarius deliciosus]|nr:hypothetical protein EDB83DRAFT_205676 [Lactarius deliciosus]